MAKGRSRRGSFPLNFLGRHATATPQINGDAAASVTNNDARPVPVSGGPTDSLALLLFHHALQGMLVLARKIHHLRHLGLGDFVGEYTALPNSVMMDVEHDLGRGFDILLEELLQNVNDEFHRRVIVIQYQDTIQIRPLGLRFDLGDDGCRRTAGSARRRIVLAHSGGRYGG